MAYEFYSTNGTKISERNLNLPPHAEMEGFTNHSKYVATEALKDAVNVALLLGQPLLLTGEPGTGKTRLADSIAWQLNLDLYKFYTKSTSVSRDLFYRYDALRHFHDAQIKRQAAAGPEQAPNADLDTRNYIEFQALGQAIIDSARKRAVVLIDEIDKAPRDFPNDVLNELENMEFHVRETGDHYTADTANRPILIITSNSEKNLPDAFLRRCIFFHIPFPGTDLLIEIVNNRLPLSDSFRENMLASAVKHFEEIREYGLRKKPATAELLSWIHVLNNMNLDPKIPLTNQINALRQSYAILAKTQDDIDKILEASKR